VHVLRAIPPIDDENCREAGVRENFGAPLPTSQFAQLFDPFGGLKPYFVRNLVDRFALFVCTTKLPSGSW
jgi:hypothetical protein